jgi:enamine deaminase RidA (YjgF/YER057c/UK114 family)
MSITRIGVGPRLSQAVIHGDTVYLAGQVADNPVPSVAKQTKQILRNIDKLLKQAGTSKSKIIKANIWLSDIRTFDEMNKIWDGWVAKGNTPARATVEARLAGPEYLVEIMVTAAK